MIAHAVTGSGFSGVMSYLETGKDMDSPERVEWSSSRNLATDQTKAAASIMRHTANQSVRCKKPVYHMSISWPEGDNIDKETMESVAGRTLNDIGLGEHQALIVAHNDTDHKHLHIVVNRVHPETGKAWANSHDRKRIMQSLRDQEKELGLEYVPNRLTDPEKAPELQPSATRGEVMRARQAGEDPLKRMTPDQIKSMASDLAPLFADSHSWQEFDTALKVEGLEMQPKGRGYILTDGENYTKFSSLGRQAKRSDMEQRFEETRKDFDVSKSDEKEQQIAYGQEQYDKADAEKKEIAYGQEQYDKADAEKRQALEASVSETLTKPTAKEQEIFNELRNSVDEKEQKKAEDKAAKIAKIREAAERRREREELEKEKGLDDDRSL